MTLGGIHINDEGETSDGMQLVYKHGFPLPPRQEKPEETTFTPEEIACVE